MRLNRLPIVSRRAQRGLSIVELMVGITIGLFIVAGASLVVTEQLSDNRRLLLETQVQQDMRAAADIVVRDIRRAGYSGAAPQSVWPVDAAALVANPYSATAPASAPGGTGQLTYSFSRDRSKRNVADNGVIDDDERSGFRLGNAGTIDMLLGAGNWQALTDANVLRITRFVITLNSQPLDVPCAKPCAGLANCPRRQFVRDVTVDIVGQAVHDARVQRSLRSNVRLRNDELTGVCPA